MIKEGLYYFRYSLKNLDDFPDPYYVNDVIIIDPVKNKDFLVKVNQLRDLITTYCCLKENTIKNGNKLHRICSLLEIFRHPIWNLFRNTQPGRFIEETSG